VSRENVEIFREVLALAAQARESGKRPPHTDLVAPDAEIDLSRPVFNPEIHRGIKGLVRLNDELREVWKEWRITPERYVDVGDRVVVIATVHGRGRRSGAKAEVRSAWIWTLLDGRVTRVEIGLDPREALKVVGLDE
jgi:ketosteroid isomerase-like protein